VAGLIVPDNDHNLQGVHVELQDIGKSFGGTRALEGVSLTISRGSIHALVGENGAGKSTLGKIIAGAHTADAGQMLLAGEPVRFHSPRDAIDRGVNLIAQELSIMGSLTVEQNVFLGVEPSQAGFQNRRQAEGRDPPRALPERRADRDGRADRRALPARRRRAARGHQAAGKERHHGRARLALPRRGAGTGR
jgi:ABC-type sugar transport system ATPase subunit